MRRIVLASAPAVALVLVAASQHPALAAWPHTSTANLPVCTAFSSQLAPTMVSDGAGGAIVAWTDVRSGSSYDIYAQHILATGAVDPGWPANGRALCTAAGGQDYPHITSDGAGGAIVAWEDHRSGAPADIYAQHVLASGTVDPAWPADGRGLCTAINDQVSLSIVPDDAGGAIVAWRDLRGANNDVYAQRVLASGAVDPAWPADGRLLCAAAGDQTTPAALPDGAGGAIVTWQDFRNGTSDIFAQHVLASGALATPFWPADGVALCTAPNNQQSPAIESDGARGAIVAWQDFRGGNYDIYVMHVLSSGTLDAAWPPDGRSLCAAVNNQESPAIVSDGAAGAIVAWQDLRGGSTHDIYAQHVLTSGAVDAAWPVDGRAICSASSAQLTPSITLDGGGGALVAWRDFRSATIDVYAQHVSASGVVDASWPVDGRGVCTATGNQEAPAIATDGAAGAILAWSDPRSGSPDIYAQRVARHGFLGTPEAEIIAVRDVPNDNGGTVKVSWYASWLDTESNPNLASYEIYRSVPPNLMTSGVIAGARLLASPGELPEPGRRAFLITALGTSVYAWEYVTTQSALHYIPAYSYLAATESDSSGLYNPRTVFMIVARNSSGSMYWLSRPDSGYSADNVAPIMPAPFQGNFTAGATHLHWNPNPESDLAGYRLYRGASASFTPGPGNLVSDQPDTGYVDASPAGGYYKLSALDVHDNQSAYALLTPAQTTGVSSAPEPQLMLEAPRPNPARDDVTVGFALPRAARVELTVFDALGRHTRTLTDGEVPAGRHAIRWDFLDDGGQPVPNGLYLVRLVVEGRVLTQRLSAIH